ncbi:MAG: hypothetical protein LKG40_06675 [Lachnospiraceae bacterium]|nr:hypothetical protein [Lachnospiraceae bacterium]MCI1328725.1 hypothetical protein [Lachnospiraceae bacterium]
MKLNRAFTKREIVLLLIGAALLIALFYWRVAYIPLQDELASYDTTDVEAQIAQEQAKAAQIKKMQDALANNEAVSVGEIATYDNLTNEINELNTIVSGTTSFNFDFKDPYMQGTTVRRDIDLTFTAANLSAAESVISQLYGCKYRLLIGNMTLQDADGSSNLQNGPVTADVSVTFFETTVGAQDLSGLMVMDDSGNLVTQDEYQKEEASGQEGTSSSSNASN